MPEVKVSIHGISHLTTSTKVNIDKEGERTQVTKISFESEVAPSEIARLLHIQRSGHTLDVAISAPQATMDLVLQPVDSKTGEVFSDQH